MNSNNHQVKQSNCCSCLPREQWSTWKNVFSLDSVIFPTAEILNSERPIAFNLHQGTVRKKTVTNIVTLASGIRQALEDAFH